MDCDYERTLSGGKAGFAEFLEAIESYFDGADMPPDVMIKVMIVFDELVSNILDHGSATTIIARLRMDMDALTVDLIDDGTAFDPLSLPEPDTSLSVEDRPIGGLGIHIVRKLIDSIAYSREGDRNRLRFAKTFAIG